MNGACPKFGTCAKFRSSQERGFTLLEIILVFAIISVIATVILPNLRTSVDSQMRTSIDNFSAQIKAVYDDAVFTGRIHRLVVDVKTGTFWAEQAPIDFSGRPTAIDAANTNDFMKQEALKTLLTNWESEEKNLANRLSSLSTEHNSIYYTIRSIPLVQKDVLHPIPWKEVTDGLIYRQQLPEDIMIARFLSVLSTDVLEYSSAIQSKDKNKQYFGYIYFLPDGTATGTSIRLATKDNHGAQTENAAKYTLNLNTLTGQTHLLEGFQNADFTLPKK